MDKKKTAFFINLIYIAVICLIFYLFIKYALLLIMPFIISFIIAALLQKPIGFLTKMFRIPRALSSAVCTVFVYSVLLCALFFISQQAVIQAKGLLSYIPALVRSVSERLTVYFNIFVESMNKNSVSSMIIDFIKSITAEAKLPELDYMSIIGGITRFAVSIPSLFVSFFVTLISTYFIGSDYSEIMSYIRSRLSKGTAAAVSKTKRYVLLSLAKWIRAQFILVTITFFELLTGFLILRVEYAFVLALITSAVDALPIFGVGTVLVPWAIISALTDNVMFGIYLLVLYGIISAVRNIMEPHIVGQSIGLHPLAALISIYFGFRFFGIIGMFISPLLLLTVIQLSKWGYMPLSFNNSNRKTQTDN